MSSHGAWADWTDYLYPRISGTASDRTEQANERWKTLAEADERAVTQLGSDESQLKLYVTDVDKLLEREQSHKQSVESRLTSIIGLMSIAATIVLSGLVALASGTIPLTPGLAVWIFALGSLYLVLQLFVALNAAVRGLARAEHLEDTANDLFAASKSASGVRLRAQITRKLAILRVYRRNADGRVDQLAVAHRAIKNSLQGLLILAAAAALLAIVREAPRSPSPIEIGTSMPASSPTSSKATSVASEAAQSPGIVLMRIATIGPFPDAEHILDSDEVLRCLRTKLTPEIMSTVGGWHIVGRVDKRGLRPDRAALYGSNQALAMNRAIWVRDKVLARIPRFESERSMVAVGGAGQVGPTVRAPDLQTDRAVDIYALLAPKSGKELVVAQGAACRG